MSVGDAVLPEAVNLLVGGRSTEHDTSVHSYEHVLAELVTAGAAKLGIAGVVYVDRENHAHVHRAAPWPRTAVELVAPPAEPLLTVVAEFARSASPIFSMMHGNEGEDGAWQGLAEIVGLSGNFGSVFTSALAMNKFAMAALATSRAPLRVPRTILLDWRADDAELAHAIAALGQQPCVVKPNRMGSSLLAERHDSLDLATLRRLRKRAFPYDSELLIQQYIPGEEYTAGCLEIGQEPVVLPIVRAVTATHFLGHEEKHRRGRVRPELVAADAKVGIRISEMSRTLFRSFDFLGMCRFDYIMGDDGDLYFLEANTLPGLSRGSAYPLMLRAAGFGMADLITACIASARSRPRRRKVLCYEVDR